MPASSQSHSPTPEEIMAYLDGETIRESRSSIEAHLATCKECEMVAASFRDLSKKAAGWAVEPAPVTMQIPATVAPPGRARILSWRPSRVMLLGLTAAAALVLIVYPSDRRLARHDMAGSLPAVAPESRAEADRMPPPGNEQLQASAPAARFSLKVVPPGDVPTPRTAAVIRTASLRIVARDFDGVRAAVEAIVASAGGFIDQMTVSGDARSAGALSGTLRVPGDHLSDTLSRLRQLGQVTEDTQGSGDVTDQIVDLDARLVSARATEQRLAEILRTRTGKLSDVLEVERELARVRLDIERLDAEKNNIGRRVSYATIGLTVNEERKAGLDAGPLSFATRIRIAAADGLEAAFESVAITTLMLLRSGPTVVTWSVLVGLLWVLARRFRRTAAPGSNS